MEELFSVEERKEPASGKVFGRLTEREKIRKEYRHWIRRYRRGTPGYFESPDEIEKWAGILESEEKERMHRLYETARYDKEPVI